MPPGFVKTSEAEILWKKAKVITEQETGMTEADGDDFWKYVTGVFKKSSGIMESATAKEIHAAAHEAATSHLNDLPQPTEAQAKAGVYKHGHIRLHGLGISIENPKGSTRSGIDPNGQAWKCTLSAHYGYVKKTVAPDGDNFDVYIADNPESEKVFVVDQLDADTGKFDECKGILGCDSHEEAKQLYCDGFSDGKGPDRIGAITELSIDTFKKWLREGDTMKPVSNAILESAWRDAFDTAMEADIVLESALEEPIELTPGAVGKLKQQVVEEINSFGFHSKPSSVTATTIAIQYILKGHGKQLRKGDEKYLREAIEDPTEVLPNIGEPGKEYRERSVLLIHRANDDYIAIVEVSPGENNNVLWNFWKMRGSTASKYLAKFRQEKTRLLQSGGRPIDPHIPHSKVGKPEGLSGSQTETSGSFDKIIPLSDKDVNKITESASDYNFRAALNRASSFEDIQAVFASLWPFLVKVEGSTDVAVLSDFKVQTSLSGEVIELRLAGNIGQRQKNGLWRVYEGEPIEKNLLGSDFTLNDAVIEMRGMNATTAKNEAVASSPALDGLRRWYSQQGPYGVITISRELAEQGKSDKIEDFLNRTFRSGPGEFFYGNRVSAGKAAINQSIDDISAKIAETTANVERIHAYKNEKVMAKYLEDAQTEIDFYQNTVIKNLNNLNQFISVKFA